MLEEILDEIERENGPITVKELARRLGVEPAALEGMLDFLERKGKLELRRSEGWEECAALPCRGCVFSKACPKKKTEGGA